MTWEVGAPTAPSRRPRPNRSGLSGPLGEQSLDSVIEAVDVLRGMAAGLPLPLHVPGAPQARRERDALIRQMDDYLLPRLMRRDAPLLTVIGGSTGAGKSTLTNSLLRREVSRSGVLRPTTRSPVLVHNPADSGVFLSGRILPGLTRVTQEGPEPAQPIDIGAPRITALRLVPHRDMPAGMALVDAPDIDSLVGTNRELAVQLLEAADLWVFVTTAARYADAVPWRLLDAAGARGVAVAVVLDRVPPDSVIDLRTHLADRLAQSGLGDAPIFTIPETAVIDGYLPADVVRPLWAWLTRIATDKGARDMVVRRTLQAVVGSLHDRVALLATAVDDQVTADAALRDTLELSYLEAEEGVAERLTDGTILRGDVLARWPEFLGARGDVNPGPMMAALHAGIVAAVTAQAQEAATDVVSRWRSQPAGVQLLEGEVHALTEPSEEFRRRLSQAVTAWQGFVVHTVARRKPSRRTRAAVEHLGAEAAAIVLIFAALEKRRAPDAVPNVVPATVPNVLPDAVPNVVPATVPNVLPDAHPDSGPVLLGGPAPSLGRRDAADRAARGTPVRGRRALSTSSAVRERPETGLDDVANELRDAIFGVGSTELITEGIRADFLGRVEAVLEVERSRFLRVLARADIRPGRGDALRAAVAAVVPGRGAR